MKSLAEALLPQPPSFNKKKHYDVHQVLGTGTFGKGATWHVPRYCRARRCSCSCIIRLFQVLSVPSTTQAVQANHQSHHLPLHH
ncbi:hypothetical protein JOM56_013422 [Amanita muscaria]